MTKGSDKKSNCMKKIQSELQEICVCVLAECTCLMQKTSICNNYIYFTNETKLASYLHTCAKLTFNLKKHELQTNLCFNSQLEVFHGGRRSLLIQRLTANHIVDTFPFSYYVGEVTYKCIKQPKTTSRLYLPRQLSQIFANYLRKRFYQPHLSP